WKMVWDKSRLLISLKLIEGKREQTVWDSSYAIDIKEYLSVGSTRAPGETYALARTIVKDIIAHLTTEDTSS
ncbi:MAG: hypothetical protein PVF66_03530, partial [Candidatus Aminicenantes bacterium]